MHIFDLSVPVRDGADWYKEEITPPVRLERIGSLEKDGWVSENLAIQVLNGTTYLETSAHMLKDGPTLDQVSPEKFICRGFVVHLGGDEQEIPAPPEPLNGFRPGEDALLLHSGWDTHVDSPDYYSASRYFSKPLQDWVLEHNPSIMGGDMLSFDHPGDWTMPFLKMFFQRGGMVLCPLVGLERMPDNVVTLCAAPLRLVGASAAPCRALAWVSAG